MENISVFDILKVGVGPSSSHTLGPWKAALWFLEELGEERYTSVGKLQVHLYGSLSLTGKGHATDVAVVLGLLGLDPETVPVEEMPRLVAEVKHSGVLNLGGARQVPFDYDRDIYFHREFLPYHANGIRFVARGNNVVFEETYYSTGGGFVQKESDGGLRYSERVDFPFPIGKAADLLRWCTLEGKAISEIVYANELALRAKEEIRSSLNRIWEIMLESMYQGCHTEGELPGGLHVRRRAYDLHRTLIRSADYRSPAEWLNTLRQIPADFRQVMQWVSCFALAVNEVNASLGRVVTAPTNGSAGVIPAVLAYYLVFENRHAGEGEISRFLMTAAEIGSIFKKNATLSAAMGGCQAEIGVSSAMAAAGLCEVRGGSVKHVMAAAEIAMEHHLGLTCDPIAGLVQIPCIERNTMGAIKAINAAELALGTNVEHAKVTLDKVVRTMWETAKDMNQKYKETSEGGLALSVNWVDC